MNDMIRAARHALLWTAPPVVGVALLLSVVRGVHSLAARTAVDRAPVYTVTALRTHLAQDPHGWLGRLLWVQGVAISSVRLHRPDAGSMVVVQPQLLDPAAPSVTLPLVVADADPLWVWLRQLPLLDGLRPPPQRVRWQMLAHYRIVLRESASGGTPGGDEAVLLDGAWGTTRSPPYP